MEGTILVLSVVAFFVLGAAGGLYAWKRHKINKIFQEEAKTREEQLLKAAEAKIKERLNG